jgi:GTP pyrophosphokinase
LLSGDQVEILTSRKQAPQSDWLDFVTTAKAKAKLKSYFKREEKQLIAEGQKLVEDALENIHILPDNENIIRLLNYFKFNERNSLFIQVAKGKVNIEDIDKVVFKQKSKNVFAKYLKMPFGGSDNKNSKSVQPVLVPSTKVDRKKNFVLSEENANITYKFADCCHPIPGDDVLGYVDESEMVVIHKRQCPTASVLKSNYGERLVSASWLTNKLLTFLEVLEIRGIDKKGVMIEILKVISEKFGGNISKINIETTAGVFVGSFHIYVHDTEDIDNLCKNISKIKEVRSVHRM